MTIIEVITLLVNTPEVFQILSEDRAKDGENALTAEQMLQAATIGLAEMQTEDPVMYAKMEAAVLAVVQRIRAS